MKTKTLRLTLWISAGIGGALIVLVAAAFLYTGTEAFRALLREKALAAVRNSVNGEFTFETLSGSIWRRVDVHDVSIVQDGVRTLFAPRVSIKMNLIRQAVSFLFSSNLHVEEIEIEAPVVRLVQGKEGTWNLAALIKKPEDPGVKREMTVYLDRLKIEHGRVEAVTAGGRKGHLAGLALDASLILPPDGVLADIADLRFQLAADAYPNTSWVGSLAYEASGGTSHVEVRHLDLRSDGSYLRLSGRVEDLARPKSDLSIVAKRLAAADLRMFIPAVPLRQDLAGSIKAAGPVAALRLTGTLAAADGRINASVLANLSDAAPRYRGTLEIKDFVTDRVLEIRGIGGTLMANASFRGAGGDILQASARGSVAGLDVEGWRVRHVALAADLAERQLNLSAVAQGQGGKADVKGRLFLGTQLAYEINVNARDLDLTKAARSPSSVPLPAQLNLDLWLKGKGSDLNRADAEGKLTVYPSRIGSVRIARGSAAATLRRGELDLREARLVSNEARFQAEGRLGNLQQGARGKIKYSLKAGEIAPWLELAGVAGSGSVEIEGVASGSLDALGLEGRGSVSRLSIGGASFQSGSARWTLAHVRGPKPHGAIKATVTGVKAGVQLQRVDADVALGGTEPLAAQTTVVAEDREKRTHRIKARILSSKERHQISLQEVSLQLGEGAWQLARPAEVLVQKETVYIEGFDLQRATHAISLNGAWSRRGAQNLQLRVKGFPLNEVRTLWQAGPDVAGLLDLEAKIAGTAAAPVIDASLAARPIVIAGESYAGLSGTAAYRGERLRLDFLLRQDAGHSLTLQGGLPLPLAWDGKPRAVAGEADLHLKSDGLSPAFAGLFTNELENVRGTLMIDLRLRGPARALAPQGQLQLREGQMQVRSLGLFLRDMELHTRVAPDRLQVVRLFARSGAGEVSGSGDIGLKGQDVRGFDLALRAEDFRMLNRRDLQAAVTGRVSASGTTDQPRLRGELTVTESTLRPNLPLLRKGPPPPDPTIVVVRSEDELAMPAQPAEQADASEQLPKKGFLERIGLDLALQIPRNTWVRLDEGAVELAGVVRVRKEPFGPASLSGTIEVVRGSYNFQGRQFRIERGRVIFTGGPEIDPRIEIIARHRVPKYVVDLVIGGTARKPTLTLKSDPPLEQADVLAVLLFGKPVGALSESQQIGLRSQAIKATADFVASDLRQSVARSLGLDTLEFEFGEDMGQGRIAFGKYVAEDVFVSASQGVGKEKEQEYSVEYELAPNWRLKGSTTTQGKSGIDLIWRKEY